jgi:hypothetical protein
MIRGLSDEPLRTHRCSHEVEEAWLENEDFATRAGADDSTERRSHILVSGPGVAGFARPNPDFAMPAGDEVQAPVDVPVEPIAAFGKRG